MSGDSRSNAKDCESHSGCSHEAVSYGGKGAKEKKGKKAAKQKLEAPESGEAAELAGLSAKQRKQNAKQVCSSSITGETAP